MATFRVTKAKMANGFTLGSLQRCLAGVSEAELESSPTLKRIWEIVEEVLFFILGEDLDTKSTIELKVSHCNECFSRASP